MPTGTFVAPIVIGFVLKLIGGWAGLTVLNVLGILLMFVGAAGVVVGIWYNLKTWPRAYAKWQNLWLCNRCGCMFYPSA